MEEEEEDNLLIPKPADWFTIKVLSLQAEIIYNCLVFLLSPFLSLLSLLSECYHSAQEAKEAAESAIHAAAKVPSSITHGSILLLRKLGLGFIGALYVCMVMVVVMILAAVVGFGLVQFWVEEPVFVRENLYFDYTEFHPKAVFSFGGGSSSRSGDGGSGGSGGGFGWWLEGKKMIKNKKMGVPIGHTIYVSVVLLMPESDFNREIGVFQLTAELLSTEGNVITKSSLPCMLRFQSLPIRLTRTFLMGIPLILGISSETQTITVEMIKHKERKNNPRTKSIRVTLSPRAGTLSLPQLYEAEILINSQLPWIKNLMRNWKWTFYIWTSICTYMLLLLILLCCFRPLVFPMRGASFSERRERDWSSLEEVSKEPLVENRGTGGREEMREISESLRRWQRSRSKRKVMFFHGGSLGSDNVGTSSAASSISVSRDDTSLVAAEEEDVGDSESVCA